MLITNFKRVGMGLGLTLLFSLSAFADIPVGYVSYDVTGTDSAEFDISNLTGPNSAPPDFPITTSVNLSSLSLVVHFSNGSVVTEGSSYFTLQPDGLSWDGNTIGIGGTNPQPTEAILTGMFSPTTIDVSGMGTVTIDSSFSATILPSSPPDLADGDLAVIYASPATTSPVPETSSVLLLGTVIALIGLSRLPQVRGMFRKVAAGWRAPGAFFGVLLAACFLLAPNYASAQTVNLSSNTTPSSGVAGANNVNVTASAWPSGDTTPANVMVSWEATCGGSPVTTNTANSIKSILGSTKRVNVNIPGSLPSGTYYVQLTDTAASDTDFTSSDCSLVQVTGTSRSLAACVPASSLGVVAPVTGPAAVYAIAPNASWDTPYTQGAQIVQIETGGGSTVSPVSLALPDYINSCAGNPATGEAVCVGNDKNVYHIRGVGTTNTFTSLVSGATAYFSGPPYGEFSGGTCENCGVAVNANGNYAVLTEGNSSSPSKSALQTLNLATDTFLTPFLVTNEVSENIAIDPNRGVILSANESDVYDLISIDASGNMSTEYAKTIGLGVLDSSTEDCATGIALAPAEFTNSFTLVDLTQATFTAGTPGSWTAPQSIVTLIGSYSAGLSGSAVAPGGEHLAVVTGEFGGSSFAVLKLPSTSGSGTPTLPDYAYVCAVNGFSAGYDPHTLTAYVSPNDGKSYGLFANWTSSSGPTSLLQADLAGILALPRASDGHTIIGDFSGCGLNPTGTVGTTVLKNFSTH